ncbi:hypothetical protein [Paraburkholderia diazotrophica]|uniref:hypothetical protein n=1 Tax=Paraburkholderia diazotrophica TaxID=667676 RepID=UPI00317C6A9D
MSSFSEIDYQRQLIVSSLDDFTPNAALPNVYGGQFGGSTDMWKRAVIEFLCVNVKCGLIEAIHRKELSANEGAHRLKNILICGGDENHIDMDIVWNALYFNSTPRLDEILERLNMRTWEALKLDLSGTFIAELKDVYGHN